jgi:hypothetical protein
MPVTESFLFESQFTKDDWKESILEAEARNDLISRDNSNFQVTIIVPFEKYKAAIRFILGYSYVDATRALRRLTPQYHPVYTFAYATRVGQITFSSATGKADGPFSSSVAFAVYVWARIPIEFVGTPYDILEDDDVGAEYARYVTWYDKPFNELVNVDPGVLKYVAPSFPPGNPGGNPLMVPVIRTMLEKERFQLKWWEVPLDFIQDPNGKQPKLSAIQKRVNRTAFLGRPAGTLLCETVETTEPKPMPVATDDFQEILLTVDVTFNLIYFDPPRGDTAVDKFGWNLQPGQRLVGVANEPVYQFFYATHDGTLTGNPQWGSYEFANAFMHWSI